MATLNTLAADVYTITNRPDLVMETTVALKKSIRKLHGADTFKQDMSVKRLDITALTPIAPNQFRWLVPLSEFERVRRFKSVQYPQDLIPPVWTTPAPLVDGSLIYSRSKEFTQLSPDDLFDSYGYEKGNYYFIAGSSLTVRASYYIDYLDFYFYQWPLVPTDLDATVLSWIAEQYPDAIIEEAASSVFKMIGKDEEYARFAALFNENLAIIKTGAIGEN